MSKENMTEITNEEKQKNLQAENELLREELTKRNADFMYQFMKLVDERGQFKGDLVTLEHDMLTKLVAGQKEGKTAKHLYGTPTEFVVQVEEAPTKSDLEPSPFWQLWVDGGLLIGGIFALIVGITNLIGSGNANAESSGILSLAINFIAGGFAMAVLTQNQPNFNESKEKRGTLRYIIIAVITLVVWITVITGVTILVPAQFNPILPPFYYIAIGAIGIAARWWFKKQYNVKNTMF